MTADRALNPMAPVALATTTRRVHPIVKLDYPIRIVGHMTSASIIVSVFLASKPSPLAWAWLAFTTLAWSHVAYWLGRSAADSKRAELGCLTADTLILSAWAGLLGFDITVTAVFAIAMISTNLSVGGVRFALGSVLVFIVGAFLGTAAGGFAGYIRASETTHLFASITLSLFMTMFGIQSYAQTRAAIRANREVKARNAFIEQQAIELERERQSAELAREEAEQANRAKSAFLANMSHELRTPLNAVIGYTELLEDDLADTPSVQSALPDLARIKGAARHLLRLINDVLDLSKIDSGRVQLHVDDVDLTELMDAVATSTKSLITANSNQLVMNVEPNLGPIRADSARLRQVLYNLLSNAAKFTSGGKITFSARRQATPDQVVFDVEDTGIGLSEAQRQNLFKPFEQVDSSTTRPFGGSGLGLVISRRLCELMDGSVSVVSEPGKGSRFTVCIPDTGNALPIPDAITEKNSHAKKIPAESN